MKWLAIFNPRCGQHLPEDLRELSAEVHRRVGADIAWTPCRKGALQLVRQNPNYDGYIAVGGDGTIVEAVNGMNREAQVLGIIPAGTGNGLAHDLGLWDINAAIA